MSGRSMFRYPVLIDDRWHSLALTGDPVAVADGGRYVEFWAEHADGAEVSHREFRVFGTGHPLPDDAQWVGTCARSRDGLVWHLYERTTPAAVRLARGRVAGTLDALVTAQLERGVASA